MIKKGSVRTSAVCRFGQLMEGSAKLLWPGNSSVCRFGKLMAGSFMLLLLRRLIVCMF